MYTFYTHRLIASLIYTKQIRKRTNVFLYFDIKKLFTHFSGEYGEN